MPPTLTELCKKSEMITQKTKEIRHEIKRIEKKELDQLEEYLTLRQSQESLKKRHDRLSNQLQYLSDTYNNKLPSRLKDVLKIFQSPYYYNNVSMLFFIISYIISSKSLFLYFFFYY